MDTKIPNIRSRSKSIGVSSRRLSTSYPHSFDAENGRTFKQEKDKKNFNAKQNLYLDKEFLPHNLDNPSAFIKDDSKHNVNKLLLTTKRERFANHRFSVDVLGHLKQDQDEIASYKKSRHNSVFGNIQPLSSFSFHKKNVFDLEKTKAKILDPKKDPLSRMRNLKQLSDKCTFREIEDFYKKYYTFIYHTMHEYLKPSENQQARTVAVSSKHLEAKECAVQVFEVLLCCIPAIINKKWQYRSIASIIRNMLQFNVFSKTFNDGLRLFVVWYSILMEYAEEGEHALFSKLLSCHDGSGNYDIFIFSSLLKFIVHEIKNVHWDEQATSYNFMLHRLETCYLTKIFPNFRHCDYTSFQCESFECVDEEHDKRLPNHQRVVIDWLVSILGSYRRDQSISRERFGLEELIVKMEAEGQEVSERCDPPETTGSPSGGDVAARGDGAKARLGERYEFHFDADEKSTMRNVLFASRANVNMVLEIFCQGFARSIGRGDLIKEICHIYRHWLMGQNGPGSVQRKRSSLDRSEGAEGQEAAMDDGEDVKIEKQKLIQIFISQSCNVFFYDWKNLEAPKNKSSHVERVQISNHVLNLYRKLIMDVSMEMQTWNCLLEKLMGVSSHVILSTLPDMETVEDLCKKLIESLLVAFVRASLAYNVPKKLWDAMSSTMAALMHSGMVVHQWATTMVMLTKMLGHCLYNIDLLNASDDSKRPKKKPKPFDFKRLGNAIIDDSNCGRTEESGKSETTGIKSASDEGRVSLPDLEKSSSSSEISGRSLEKIMEAFCASEAEVSFDVDGRIDPLPSSSSADDNNADSSRDARSSSFCRSESSGSLENSGASSSIIKDSDGVGGGAVPQRAENSEEPCKCETKLREIARESSMDDKPVELDLTELKEHRPEGDRLRSAWLKMLCVAGNVASMSAERDFLVNHNLKAIHDCMLQIYKHQDFVNDGKFPILVLVPWTLQIIHTPQQLPDNKLIAYSMICDYMLHVPLSSEYLSRFYFTIHVGIQSSEKDISRAIVRHCSKQIFGRQMERGVVLLEDFLHAAVDIMHGEEQTTRSQIPDRIEAARLLASLVHIPNHYDNDNTEVSCGGLKVLDPRCPDVRLKTCDLNLFKNVVISILINSINGNQKHSRVCSFSICGLGIFLLEEISLNPNRPLVLPVIKCLLSVFSLDSSSSYCHIDKLLACQALSVLRDHHQILHGDFQRILRFIFENLLIYINHSLETESLEKEFKIVSAIVLNLLEWFLILPVHFLLERIKEVSLLDKFFKTLMRARVVCERELYQNERVYALQMELFIEFVFCQLVNYTGHHGEVQEMASSESVPPVQLMMRLDRRIFEASHSANTSDVQQNPWESLAGFYISRACNLTTRDLAGRWWWSVRVADDRNRDRRPTDSSETKNEICSDDDLAPTDETSFKADDIHEDFLIKALNLIADTSPECIPCREMHSLTVPFPCSEVDPIQDSLLSSLMQQRDSVWEFAKNHHRHYGGGHVHCKRAQAGFTDSFESTRMLLKITRSFGISCGQDRNFLDLLMMGDQVCREIKHLDAQRCLETHKVAIFYVGPNQYSRNEILLNNRGSPSFEDFFSHLGELVDLRHHRGFLGGLSSSGSTGDVAPYYSPSSLLQVIFHVSTLLGPGRGGDGSDEDVCVRKMRHLGNDEVHIVWMENSRGYTTDLIPTKFGEVTIVVYPLPRHLFRIQILKKIMMDTFGPLFDGAIVGRSSLPALVRSTAVNAGRAIRETRDHYQRFYEERYSTLVKIAGTYKKKETYEQFLCSAMIPGVEDSSVLSFLSMDPNPKGHAESPSQQARAEKRIKVDQNKKTRSEFILPLKVKTDKRSQDAK